MNTLKFGSLMIERCEIPGCASCVRRGDRSSRECLCAGTGRYKECECCGFDMVGGYYDGRCFRITTSKRALTICRACIGVAVADELPELGAKDEPDYHLPSTSTMRSAS